MIRIAFSNPLPKLRTPDASAFTLVARFLDSTVDPWVPTVPKTAEYRIDLVRSNGDVYEVRGWTTLAPAEEVAIGITEQDNDIPDVPGQEYREVRVRVNASLEGEGFGSYRYVVERT